MNGPRLNTFASILVCMIVSAGCERPPEPSRALATSVAEVATTAPVPVATSAPTPASTSPTKALSVHVVPADDDASLTVATYNVLASPVFTDLRADAVSRVLQQTNADIIALQEVAPWFLEDLRRRDWVSGYHFSEHDGEPFAPGGQLILSRFPIASVSAAVLPGRQRRTVLLAKLTLSDHELAVATSHMESPLAAGATRARQLEAMFGSLSASADAMLVGDLNFGDGEQPETAALPASYRDPWLALHPGEPGFTWDMDHNPLAFVGAFVGEGNRRLDRILVKSERWQATHIGRIGTDAAAERKLERRDRGQIEMPDRTSYPDAEPTIAVHPSDHFGVIARFVRTADR